MRISLDTAVGSGSDAALPALSLATRPGAVSSVVVETEERPVLVALLLAGRLRPTAGRVLLDGTADEAALRRRTALVDVPVVAEPPAGVRLGTVVAEELALAGLPSGRAGVRDALERHGLAGRERHPVRSLGAAERIRLLAGLAAERPGVEAIVLGSPDRHGGDPADWYPALAALAERGIDPVVVTDLATHAALVRLGAHDATAAQEAPEAQP